MASKPVSEMGPIREGESYPLALFKRLTGLSSSEFRELQLEGLKLRRVGKMSYVLGRDWIQHLKRQSSRGVIGTIHPFWATLLAKFLVFCLATD